jgi:hypothetical protein
MLSIAQLPGAAINHRYRIYEKALLPVGATDGEEELTNLQPRRRMV